MSTLIPVVSFILIVAILLVVVAILVAMFKPSDPTLSGPPPYQQDNLLTPKEKKLYADLYKMGQDHNFVPLAKVRLVDLITVDKEHPHHQAWQQKAREKSADFVLCDGANMETVLVVELDRDNSQPAKIRAEFFDSTCKAAGIPIIHVRDYNYKGLEKAVLEKIGRLAPAPAPTEAQAAEEGAPAEQPAV